MNNKLLEFAKEKLSKEDLTCVLYNGDETYISSKRGVAPLLEWVKEKKNFDGFVAADKVVGKAAAFLYVILNIKEVYAFVISKRAAMVFEQYGIKYSCESIVDEIVNRAGTGFCPMEQATKDIDKPKEALEAIKKKYAELMLKNEK